MKRFLSLIFLGSFLMANAQQPATRIPINPALAKDVNVGLKPFYHGVASGDPTENAVIIWTKVSPDGLSMHPIVVNYVVSLTPEFTQLVKVSAVTTSVEKDFTVKADVKGLNPGTEYYYRFEYNGMLSPIGKTKTLPKGDNIGIAFVACSNFEWGFFNNYRFIAEDDDVDLVVHLGDYIYEYAPGGYGDTLLGRKHVPAKEIVSLSDYRTRYSQYRLDPDLQKAHRLKPFITVWDDHESANNAYIGGAQNHQANEGDWYARKKAAKQAYYEWMPVREPAYHELYRSFQIGNFVNLIMLDTRIAGRTQQVDSMTDPHFMDEDRTIIGQQQFNWLTQQLSSKATWNIIGNQVPFGPMYLDSTKAGKEGYMDGWDGYPAERKKVIDWLAKNNTDRNTIWVTGDFHSSFAIENDLKGTKDPKDNVSVEFVVTSVTSANNDEYEKNPNKLEDIRQRYISYNPHIKYLNQEDHGYLLLDINNEEVVAKYYYAESIKTRTASKFLEKTFVVKKNNATVLKERP